MSIGGAHIKDAKPLPDDLQTFLDNSNNGVIYFSLGTVVQSSKLPKEKIQAFLGNSILNFVLQKLVSSMEIDNYFNIFHFFSLDSFRNLKQNVLWKFEDESLTNVPSNVFIRKWMPQNDILAHPNVILFISHGGLFGTSESLYHGVPLLLIPFFGDQHRNAHRIATAGYGKFIPFSEVTKESMSERISELINDKTFLFKAKQTSEIFKNNPVHPMDEALFWIEYVCKFKGAKHLKSHAVNMPWFTYLLLDIFIVNWFGLLIVIFTLFYLIKKLFAKKKTDQAKKLN